MIQNAFTLAGKLALLRGQHQPFHTYKLALYNQEAELGFHTIGYASQGEASGLGYDAGGKDIGSPSFGSDGTVAWMEWLQQVTWTSTTIVARGALIYNASLQGANSLAVIDFGQDVESINGQFGVQLATRLIQLS